MKGKVFGLIILTTIGIAILSYFGYFGGDTVQIRGEFVDYNCGENNINMKVTAVNDSSLLYLVGKMIAPEVSFKQKKLDGFIKSALKANSKQDFFMVGYLKKRPIRHCSGATCFKVEMIKQGSEASFTKF